MFLCWIDNYDYLKWDKFQIISAGGLLNKIQMAEQTMKCRLVNFQGLKTDSQEELQCHKDAFNSFMLKISELEEYDETDEFTECQNKDCKMILTNKDHEFIDDWYWVNENKALYNEHEKYKLMEADPWKYYFWNCRFCGVRNLIEKDKAHFAKNKSKVVLNEAMKVEDRKNYCDNPILLFLIDNSSSMEEQIGQLNDQKKISKELGILLKDTIKSADIYKKITENQEKKLKQINQQLKKQCNNGEEFQNQQFKDHLNKYKVLMALTENAVNQICGSGNSKAQEHLELFASDKDQKKSSERKIGFMFFNSDVILQKISDKYNKMIKVSDKQNFDGIDINGENIRVDFQKFHKLYTIGKENSLNYGGNISTFKFKDIQVKNMDSTQGQTALGPALSIASGIVSNYGPGSLIVVVTDGKANKGIFSSDGVYKDDLKMLKYRLDKAKAELCLIRLNKQGGNEKNEIFSDLQCFFQRNSQIINIQLDLKESPLDMLKKKLKTIVDKSVGGKTWANDVRIRCQNPNVNYANCLSSIKKKKFAKKEAEFYSPKINEQALRPTDYRYPFMTQVVVEYTDIDSKQSSIFMGYMIQKLIKYNEMKKQDKEALESMETLSNVLNYITNQGQKLDIDNLPIPLQSFKSSIMQSINMSIDKTRKLDFMKSQQIFMKESDLNYPKFTNFKDMLQSHVVREDQKIQDKL